MVLIRQTCLWVQGSIPFRCCNSQALRLLGSRKGGFLFLSRSSELKRKQQQDLTLSAVVSQASFQKLGECVYLLFMLREE